MESKVLLYDGWSLAFKPNSPAALHLHSLLGHNPAGITTHLALPGEPPAWLSPSLETHIHPTPDTPEGRLRWEQLTLPQLARSLAADWLHLLEARAPLFGRTPALISPAGYPQTKRPVGLWNRLKQASGAGGLAQARAVLWPQDLPVELAPVGSARLFALPPLFDLDLSPGAPAGRALTVELPETFVLYHGPGDIRSLEHLLACWSWAAASIGAYYPLVAINLDESQGQRFIKLAERHDLAETIRVLPPLAPVELRAVYQACTCLFHPSPGVAWGNPVRLALGAGKPIVATGDPTTTAVVGPAAYLASRQDTRGLGAGVITLIVEEAVAEKLAAAGRRRAAGWNRSQFAENLKQLYTQGP